MEINFSREIDWLDQKYIFDPATRLIAFELDKSRMAHRVRTGVLVQKVAGALTFRDDVRAQRIVLVALASTVVLDDEVSRIAYENFPEFRRAWRDAVALYAAKWGTAH